MTTLSHISSNATPYYCQPVEIVERKGIGHPDTICDALAEELSRTLCQFYLDNFGLILHHNVDKALLWGGTSLPKFGGGKIISGLSSVGEKNIEFVRCYIKSENLDLVGEDVGDIYPRKVVFYPASGRVRVKKLKHMHNDTIVKREKEYQHDIEEAPVEGTVELF